MKPFTGVDLELIVAHRDSSWLIRLIWESQGSSWLIRVDLGIRSYRGSSGLIRIYCNSSGLIGGAERVDLGLIGTHHGWFETHWSSSGLIMTIRDQSLIIKSTYTHFWLISKFLKLGWKSFLRLCKKIKDKTQTFPSYLQSGINLDQSPFNSSESTLISSE